MLAAVWLVVEDRKRQQAARLALQRRLRAFENAERIRESARVKQASHALCALTQQASRAMLLTALTAQVQARADASKDPANRRRCQ